MKASARALSWVLLTLLALTSALLCIAPPSLGSWFGVLYVGTVYGVLLTVYFITCCGIRSAPRLISLVVASSLAWPIAYFGSFAAMGFIPGGTVHHGDSVEPAFPLIALGGVLGGAALLIPALLLFKPSSVSRGAALRKAFWGILLSGIVGGIAWELGPILGSAIWHLLPTAPLPPSDSYGMAALFFVWQPVIALFIGWATSENQEPIPIQGQSGEVRAGGTRASDKWWFPSPYFCSDRRQPSGSLTHANYPTSLAPGTPRARRREDERKQAIGCRSSHSAADDREGRSNP